MKLGNDTVKLPSYERTQFTFQSLALSNLVKTNQRGVANHIKDTGEDGAAHFRITVQGERAYYTLWKRKILRTTATENASCRKGSMLRLELNQDC